MPRRLAIGNAQDLIQAERDIRQRTGGQPLDFAVKAAVSNIYRAANAIRHHLEQQALAEEDLSWAAFTVLFVLWIWSDQQTRHLAAEAGVTKGDADRRAQDAGEARPGPAPRAPRGRPAGPGVAGAPGSAVRLAGLAGPARPGQLAGRGCLNRSDVPSGRL